MTFKSHLVSLVAGLCLLTGSTCLAAGAGDSDPYRQGLDQYYRSQYDPAITDFLSAVQRTPDAPMPHFMLSRAYHHTGNDEKALAESTAALSHLDLASDEEHYLINSWGWKMKSITAGKGKPEEENGDQEKAIWNADFGIALYPESADLYILRGDLTVDAIRQAPYYLAALRLDSSSPLKDSWKRPVIPFPKVKAGPGKTVPLQKKAPGLFTGLGKVHHPITTSNPLAQKYFEQGLCEMYAYVTPDALHSFEYAAQLDPHCCMAYWGVSMTAESTPGITPLQAAEYGWNLAKRYGNKEEKWYCAARLLALQPGQGENFVDALAGAIQAYPNDPDLWVWRGAIQGFAGEDPNTELVTAGMPFILAAWHVQPDHPSANHELVHAYEAIDRPVLGWKYSWGFRRSAPNMPHAQHMQAHLAMRLGRWEEALQCTLASYRLSKAGFPELDKDHHREVLLWALAHEGRFKEAKALGLTGGQDLAMMKMLRLEVDPKALAKWAADRRKRLFIDGYYAGAIADLDLKNLKSAQADVPHLGRPTPTYYGASPEVFQREIMGRIDIYTGKYDEGVKTLERLARDQDLLQFSHRWGQGSYYDELWGEAALAAGQFDGAQEGFEEAIAHEHGSIVAAVGLQVLAEQQKRPDLAASFAARAKEIWHNADPGALDRLVKRIRAIATAKAPIM